MSVESPSWPAVARSQVDDLHERWQQASPPARTRIQLGVFVGAVVVAYHYSLSTLFQNLSMDTPLAYVGLVPAIALALAAALRRPRAEPAIHDRQLDYIVGIPLIAGALVTNMIVPNHLSALYWIWRLDLLTLPFFVAGTISLIFGVRALWRQKFAVGYLLLAWPLPYSMVLLNVLNGFTNTTIHALRIATSVVHVAKVIPGSDGSIFQVFHHGRSFPLSVVSACSGVNGVVGFLLVGSAFGAVVTGPRLRKALWLAAGMALLWVINVVRLLFIFWAGQRWGEHVAIQVLHPFVGLLTFGFGVVLMTLALRPIGLRIGADPEQLPDTTGVRQGFSAIAVPKIAPAFALVVAAALVLGISDSNLKQFDLVANAAGEPKLASYSLYPAAPQGWQAKFYTAYTWAKPYFGGNSTWYRYVYEQTGANHQLSASLPITADVINSTDLSSFSAYGVQACYRFHGYNLRDVAQVNFGAGIKGEALSYETDRHGDWSLVYWIWPVRSSGATHYERIILYLQDTLDTTVRVPMSVSGIQSLQGALDPHNPNDDRLISERAFLVQFGRDVIEAQTKVAAGRVLPGLEAGLADEGQPIHLLTSSALKARARHLGYHISVRGYRAVHQ